jgi:hypothetical protein
MFTRILSRKAKQVSVITYWALFLCLQVISGVCSNGCLRCPEETGLLHCSPSRLLGPFAGRRGRR